MYSRQDESGFSDELSLLHLRSTGRVPLVTESDTSQPKHPEPLSRIENTLRRWGLQLGYTYIYRLIHRSYLAPGRVALFRDRSTAILAATGNIPAMAGPVVLSYFVFKNSYIGGELAGRSGYDAEKMIALQFTAKLLELLISWSLASMILGFVHYEISLGESIPLASFVASFQFTSVTYLLSKDFFAVLKGSFSARRKKVFFISLIFISTFLAISAAPAVATAIIPVSDWWDAGGTDLWLNNTEARIFPDVLNDSHTLCSISTASENDGSPSAGWQSINDHFISFLPKASKVVDGVLQPRPPAQFHVRGGNSILGIRNQVREPVYDVFSPNFSVAAVPHSAIADAAILGRMHWDLAARNSTAHREYRFFYRKAERPNFSCPFAVTHGRCRLSTRSSEAFDPPPFPNFHDNDFREVNITAQGMEDWMRKTLPGISRPDIFWFDLDPEMAKNASIGALVALPASSSATVQLFGCMIDARWVPGPIGVDGDSLVASGEPGNFRPVSMDGTSKKTWLADPTYGRRVHLRPSFAHCLDPQTSSTNMTVFQKLASSSGLWVPGAIGSSSESHLEAILNAMIVNGMARTAPYTTSLTRLADADGAWWRNFMPQDKQPFGEGGNAYTVTEEQKATFYKLHMKMQAEGYAYTSNNATMKLALAVLLLYASLAAIFILVTGWSGLTSTSWNAPSELLVLGLRSSPPAPDKLPDVSAGFSTIQPLQEKYCVVAEGDSLELRQVQGRVPHQIRVQENRAYR